MVILIQVIFLASSQELNIKKIGGANFANVNVFSGFLNEDVIAYISTSGLPFSDQKIILIHNFQDNHISMMGLCIVLLEKII